jgi:hypothetical protein
MTVEYAQLRALVLDYLKEFPKGQLDVTDPNVGLRAFCHSCGHPVNDNDAETTQRIFHELYLERILITGASPRSSSYGAMGWPFYRVTEYGLKVLETQEYVPHDPEGYLARLKTAIPEVDEIILRYLEQALECYRRDLCLAAAVMVGCAAEKALLLLIETFGNALTDGNKKAKYEKETHGRMIGRKYEALWKRLQPLANSLPDNLGDDLEVLLNQIFYLIRTTRNDAGHPTGKPVERETVFAELALFPKYCRRVYELIDHFQNNSV